MPDIPDKSIPVMLNGEEIGRATPIGDGMMSIRLEYPEAMRIITDSDSQLSSFSIDEEVITAIQNIKSN